MKKGILAIAGLAAIAIIAKKAQKKSIRKRYLGRV
jgi:hypothetical protein